MTHPDEDTYHLTAASIPTLGDVFTQEALDSMVGKTVPLNMAFDWSQPLGDVTVTSAEQVGDTLRLGLSVSKRTLGRIEEKFGKPEPGEYSIGFSRPLRSTPGPGTVTLMEVAAAYEGQLFPKPATPEDSE